MGLTFYDYSYIDYPLMGMKYPFLELKDDRLLIDFINAITFTKTNNVFLSFHDGDKIRHITCEKYKDIKNEEMAYLLNLKDGQHYRAPFDIVKMYNPMIMFYSTCNNCVGTGVLDWIGATTNQFKGYCCESKNNYEDLRKRNSCLHFHKSNKYIAHIVEMQIIIKKIDYEGYHFHSGLGSTETEFLSLLGVNLSLLEKYILNYLNMEERINVENQFRYRSELEELLNKNKIDKKFIDLPAITFIKQVDDKTIDPDLYKVCPFCNGTGLKFIKEPTTIEETHYRIRSIPAYDCICEDVGSMLSMMDIFSKCNSARDFIFNINHMMRWEGYSYL